LITSAPQARAEQRDEQALRLLNYYRELVGLMPYRPQRDTLSLCLRRLQKAQLVKAFRRRR
jgi:hypothetical protein